MKTIISKVVLCFCLFFAVMSYAEDQVPVNVNVASVEELADQLKGIGVKKAEAIVAYREEFGPFTSVEELVEVKGIGFLFIDKNREVLSVN